MASRAVLLLALALVAPIGVRAPAAQAAWTAPQTVVADAGAGRVSAAGNRLGSQALTWTVTTRRPVRIGGVSGLVSTVRARVRLPDGRLGRVQTISGTRGFVADPRIGVDQNGNVTAVWAQRGPHLSVMAAYRPHGKRFGTPVELGRSRHFNDARPALAVGPFGDAVVAWNEGRSLRVAHRGVGPCRCFSRPLSLRAGNDQAVAIGPLGSAYVVWAAVVRSTAPSAVHTRLRMATLGRDGRRLGREHFISATGDASQPSLAVARDGGATIAWRASPPSGGEQDEAAPIMAAVSTPDAVTTPVQAVSAGRGERPQVRVTAGEAILAWNALRPTPANPDGPEVAIAVRAAGAPAFGAPALISPPNVAAGGASLAVDPAGTAFLLYTAGGQIAVSHVRAAASVFGPPATLPGAFAGGSLLTAGRRVSAVTGLGGRTAVSDWTA